MGTDSDDGFETASTYAPRPDYYVKPLNRRGDPRVNVRLIDEKLSERLPLLRGIAAIRYETSDLNFDFNQNPRVFLAIEDEISSPSEKHRLGSVVNASVLGKVGIVCGSPQTYASLCRIMTFLKFVRQHKDMHLGDNVIVVEKERLVALLNSAPASVPAGTRRESFSPASVSV